MKKTEEKKTKNIWLGFHKKSRNERIDILKENSLLDREFFNIMEEDINLSPGTADQITENNIGTFSLPFGIVPGILVNGKEYTVPMVTEEPSVIAACSYASKLAGKSGGFTSFAKSRKMIGEVILYGIEDMEAARVRILAEKENMLTLADASHPSIVKRGGGAKEIEVKVIDNINNYPMKNENTGDDSILTGDYPTWNTCASSISMPSFLVVYLTVDVKEAMGANIINNMLEGIKPMLEDITGGTALMAILSNYAVKSVVTSSCEIDISLLSNERKYAEEIAEKVELASIFSKLDVFRAATHNKGIFNGIDAVVIATGNDWRAIEAGGHSYASRNGKYEGLTEWIFDRKTRKLKGSLSLPMPVATVGGSIGLNPKVRAAFSLLGEPDAATLAGIIVSIGLAQNFAALKALVSTGIQKGHMKLQARSLALSAGASENEAGYVVEELLKEKHMNLENARKIILRIRNI